MYVNCGVEVKNGQVYNNRATGKTAFKGEKTRYIISCFSSNIAADLYMAFLHG